MNFEIPDLEKLDSSQLKPILKELKLYKDLKKQLGNRGIKYFNKLKTGEKTLLVEYFPTMDKNFVLDESAKIFTKIFKLENLDTSKIELVEKDSIKGGMRLFVDDKVLDLTYSKIEKQFG